MRAFSGLRNLCGEMITKYAICIVFAKETTEKIRIETLMASGTIEHDEKADPSDLFDSELALNSALKIEKSINLLKDGFTYLLENHIILNG